MDNIVFLIPILGILLGFFGVWTQHRQKLAKLEVEAAKVSAVGGGATAGEIRELKERVKVLERIVTDGGYDVATQIEALRHERPGLAVTAEPERLG